MLLTFILDSDCNLHIVSSLNWNASQMNRSQMLCNQSASNSTATSSVSVILEKSSQKELIVPTRTRRMEKLQTDSTTLCNRYMSHESDHRRNRSEKGHILGELNQFSIYENNECIVLPKRKQKAKAALRCFYCDEWFYINENPSGSCKEAPDPVERIIRLLTCYPIAQAAIYHCCRSDDDMPTSISRFGQGYNVFSFAPGHHISVLKRVKRWLFLALISFGAPCLCCYFPAHMINKCFGSGRRGRHKSYHTATNYTN